MSNFTFQGLAGRERIWGKTNKQTTTFLTNHNNGFCLEIRIGYAFQGHFHTLTLPSLRGPVVLSVDLQYYKLKVHL